MQARKNGFGLLPKTNLLHCNFLLSSDALVVRVQIEWNLKKKKLRDFFFQVLKLYPEKEVENDLYLAVPAKFHAIVLFV